MISKELFKSPKFIILISMAINIILILIGSIWFDNNYIHLELSALLILSLLLGPYSILGFTLVEVLYWILSLDISNIPVIILSASSIIVLGIMPWKLWYAINIKDRFEIPNMNSFYSFIKIIIIVFVMILQTYAFSTHILHNIMDLDLESYYMIFILGLILLLIGMGISGKLNIPTYPPKQLKRIMPNRVHDLAFILSIIISIATLNSPNNIYLLLILILSAIFLIKPLNDRVFEINTTPELSIFYKAFISIFIILVIIPTILLVSLSITGSYEHGIATEFSNYLGMLAGFFLAILIPLVIYMAFLGSQVIRPINQLSSHLSNEINDDNDLENLVNNLNSITVNNEIKSLSESLLNMEKEYVDYSANLLEVTKEKERYETELKLAHEIQFSMIPTNYKQFNENNDNISLWGFMKAAHDVGGDFYDYFKIDEENIGFVIGDVSGKGVSTALIMVKVMTLIRDYTTYYEDLSDVLYEINNKLCKDNIEGLLVSCWLGKINTKTGELSYVNAGHKQPFAKQNDGNFEFMNITPGVFLALRENVQYEKHVINLKPNDALFLYTDGVTDANDGHNTFYGKENLQKILNKNKDNELDFIINSIEKDIDEFCNNQEQYDDIAMIIIEKN